MRPTLLLLPLVFLAGLYAGLRLARWGDDGADVALSATVEAAGARPTGAATVPPPWQTGVRAPAVELEPILNTSPTHEREVAEEPSAAYRDDSNRDLVRRLDAEGAEVRGYYDSGSLRFEGERAFIDGEWVLDGDWSSFYENGQREELGAYKADKEVGRWEWWYDNGEPMANGVFQGGKREGPWSFWHPNGNRKMDATYVEGEGEGHWILYHEDGFKWAEGEYLGGEISGAWSIWNADGSLNHERSGIYENGEKVSD